MTKEQEEKLSALRRIQALAQSGYAGTDHTGRIVDRRECPAALPLQANAMLGIAEPKPSKQNTETTP